MRAGLRIGAGIGTVAYKKRLNISGCVHCDLQSWEFRHLQERVRGSCDPYDPGDHCFPPVLWRAPAAGGWGGVSLTHQPGSREPSRLMGWEGRSGCSGHPALSAGMRLLPLASFPGRQMVGSGV